VHTRGVSCVPSALIRHPTYLAVNPQYCFPGLTPSTAPGGIPDHFRRPAARSRSRKAPGLNTSTTLVSRNSLTCPHETAACRPRLRRSRRPFVRERTCAAGASARLGREAVPRERASIPASVPVAVRQPQLRVRQGCSWADTSTTLLERQELGCQQMAGHFLAWRGWFIAGVTGIMHIFMPPPLYYGFHRPAPVAFSVAPVPATPPAPPDR